MEGHPEERDDNCSMIDENRPVVRKEHVISQHISIDEEQSSNIQSTMLVFLISNYSFSIQGKVEAELYLLTEEEAEKLPAGRGRENPEGLPEPK